MTMTTNYAHQQVPEDNRKHDEEDYPYDEVEHVEWNGDVVRWGDINVEENVKTGDSSNHVDSSQEGIANV